MTRLILSGLLLSLAASAQTRGGLSEYALVLDDAPVARQIASRDALRSNAAQSRLQSIVASQKSVRAELARRRIPVTGSVQLLANAVFAYAPSARLAELQAIPGVKRVQRMPRLNRHLDRALDLMNVSAAWNSVGGAGNAGAGIKIGVIDTGIDQAHPGFQDTSLAFPTGFPKGDTAYTTRKIIVARSYVSFLVNPNNDAQYSHPDDLTPRDRVGHGTAIAMIAAGVRNSGPAATIQGVAPKAWLGNYKIFGSPGVNDFTLYSALAKAMDDALADGMDIVTLSLGEGDPAVYGPLDRDASCSADGTTVADCDVRAQLVENAVRNNMVVVTSAGNDGDLGLQFPTLNTTHTPGTAPSGITVGATTNSHIFYAGVTPQGGSRMQALFGIGAKPSGPVTGPLKDVAQTGNDGQACSSLPAGSLAGGVALVQRGTCVISDKIYYAQNAGAIAVIVYQQPGADYPFQITAKDVGIPSAAVGNSNGVTLKNQAQSNVTVTLDPALQPVDASFNTVWDSSSRGPAMGTYGIKPEVMAVGTDLYTATQKLDPNGDTYDASGYNSVTGTSYAVPMAAGTAAMVKQKNPSLSALQIKSAVVNTADSGNTALAGARITDSGAGKLNAGNAVAATISVEPATISFGPIVTGTLPASQTLKLTNYGTAAANLALAVNQRDRDSNASVRLSQSTLTLPAGQQTSVTVTLQGTRPAAGSYEGFIDITGGGQALHVPYLYLSGDGIPYNAFPVTNGGFVGVVNDPEWLIAFRVTDRYGVALVNQPVQWNVTAGGGRIAVADPNTVIDGYAGAQATLGPQVGDNIFTATVGSLVVEFDGYAGPLPAIRSGGVVDAATNAIGRGLAPGSYAAIYGDFLATTTAIAQTASLPLSIATVSVSFDAGGISAPAHLHFVSPGQVNVQIPWEVQGQSSAQMKVTIAPDISSKVYTVPLATYSPAIFVREGVAAVRDVSFNIVNASNPAKRGAAVQLYCNGLGPVDTTPPSGEPSPAQPLANTRVKPTVSVGGKSAEVIFNGLAPGNVGLYQVNFILAADTPTGNQPVVLSIGGVDSTPATMPVQ